MPFLNAVITGVSLTDDETENTQGSRYCLVAIGRLQVRSERSFLFCWKVERRVEWPWNALVGSSKMDYSHGSTVTGAFPPLLNIKL